MIHKSKNKIEMNFLFAIILALSAILMVNHVDASPIPTVPATGTATGAATGATTG